MRIRRASRSESQAQFGAVTFTPKLRENCHYPRQLYNEKSGKKRNSSKICTTLSLGISHVSTEYTTPLRIPRSLQPSPRYNIAHSLRTAPLRATHEAYLFRSTCARVCVRKRVRVVFSRDSR